MLNIYTALYLAPCHGESELQDRHMLELAYSPAVSVSHVETTASFEAFVAKAAALPHQRLPLITHQPQGDFTGSPEETFCSHGTHPINHVVSEAERNDFRNFKSFSLYVVKKRYAQVF